MVSWGANARVTSACAAATIAKFQLRACVVYTYVQSRRIRVATSDTNGKNLPVADKGGLCCCCSPINEEVNRKHIKLTNFATPLN